MNGHQCYPFYLCSAEVDRLHPNGNQIPIVTISMITITKQPRTECFPPQKRTRSVPAHSLRVNRLFKGHVS